MQQITVLVFLTMVAVSSAALCCKSGCMGLDARKNTPQKASDSKVTTFSKSSDISKVLKLKEVPTSAPKTQSVPSVSAPKIESRISAEKKKTQDKPPLDPLPQVNTQVPRSTAPISDTSPQASTLIPTQVLNLNVKEKINPHFILERKMGIDLDWKFVSVQGSEIQDVRAHKSIIIKYSPKIRKLIKILDQSGIKRNSFPLFYPVKIIESILTLMYEHAVIINKSDYAQTMEVAKALEMDGLIKVA